MNSLSRREKNRHEHRQQQNAEDEGQAQRCGYHDMGQVKLESGKGSEGIDILVHGKQHLDAYENEDDAEPVFEELEVLGYGSQRKVEVSMTSRATNKGVAMRLPS